MGLGRWRRPRAIDGVEWRSLGAEQFDEFDALVEQCGNADGARQIEHDGGWLGMRGGAGLGGYVGGQLVAAVIVHVGLGGPLLGGYVHPAHRGRGLGGAVLDWGLAHARGGSPTVETIALTPGAQRLFESRGLHLVVALERLSRPVGRPVEVAPLPPGITFAEWEPDDAYDVYAEAFAELPNVPAAAFETPGQSHWSWLNTTVMHAEGFEDLCRLARDADGRAVGLVVCDDSGPFHVGTVPQWRRRGLGLAMLTSAIAGLPAEADEVYDPWELTVNADNVAAVQLLRRAGYEVDSRAGHFQRAHRWRR